MDVLTLEPATLIAAPAAFMVALTASAAALLPVPDPASSERPVTGEVTVSSVTAPAELPLAAGAALPEPAARAVVPDDTTIVAARTAANTFFIFIEGFLLLVGKNFYVPLRITITCKLLLCKCNIIVCLYQICLLLS
jgi:hypothetical protein